MTVKRHTIDLAQLGMKDLEQVGGKNASLGEMISHLSNAGVAVPGGFATTADSFNEFLAQSGLDKAIYNKLVSLDIEDVCQLAIVGKEIRELIINTPFTVEFEQQVHLAYQNLSEVIGHDDFSVAVRSSATAEDLP
ncbi:MAG: PEP/pyruvate-binding domain-containing protein, partial [bacterium]|nr:PEP/pyruvate-binding domain-containing protein [bacterium]